MCLRERQDDRRGRAFGSNKWSVMQRERRHKALMDLMSAGERGGNAVKKELNENKGVCAQEIYCNIVYELYGESA